MQPTHYGYESFASSFLLPCKKLIGIFDLRLRCNVFDIVSVVLVKIIFFYVCVLILFFLRLIGVDVSVIIFPNVIEKGNYFDFVIWGSCYELVDAPKFDRFC